jgi:hypothetical protein
MMSEYSWRAPKPFAPVQQVSIAEADLHVLMLLSIVLIPALLLAIAF